MDNQQDSYNDSRNKDYEFGCKRIQNQKYDYQYEFYAPFYIDNVCDIPDYFLLTIEINDHYKKKFEANFFSYYINIHIKLNLIF